MSDPPQRRAEEQPAGDNPIDGDVNVVVLGMHRSGTSAVAGALRAAGLYAGRDEELVDSHAQNPDGFFERPDVLDLDDRLLSALGWAWDTPDPVPPTNPPPLADLVIEGRRIVRERLAAGGPWVLKDPRMSVLLPWWRRILLDRFVAVVSLREPAETAWSLTVRDGFSMELGLSLWAAYYRHLAVGLEGLPVVTVDYGALTEEPASVVAQLLDDLGKMGVGGPLDVEAAIAAIRPSLRRDTQPESDLGQPAETIIALRDAWMSEPVRAHRRFELVPPPPSAWEGAILLAHRTRREQNTAIATSRRELDESSAARSAAERALNDARAETAARRLQLDAAEHELAAVRERLASTLERFGAAQADLRAQRAAPEWLTETVESLRVELTSLRAESAARSDHLIALHQSAARRPRSWPGSPRQALRRLQIRVLRGAARALPQTALARLWHNPLFDRAWYVDRYHDVAGKRMHPEQHFRRHGVREGRRPNDLFDPVWYQARYPDVAASRLNPLDHYLLFGADEGRDPSPDFNTAWYREHNPDVAASGINPLLHYLRHGRAEGRRPRPQADEPEGSVTWAQPGAASIRVGTGSSAFAPAAKPRALANQTASLGVVVHLYHTSLWPEIRGFLDNLDQMQLFVSLTRETGDGFDAQILADYPGADVRYFPNRGRDMSPFVELLNEGAFEGCELVCKIHSKKSPHRVDGDDWRRRLLGELLGSADVVGQIRRQFEDDIELGLLGPADALTESDEYWGSNRDRVYELGARMGQSEDESKLSFFAGSMFWFRPAALQPLRALGLKRDDFEPEAGQVDGTLAHALERAIPVSVGAAGLKLSAFEPAGRAARRGAQIGDRTVKLLAFYLPQFHPIPENDEWWGPGFTEWSQVAGSRPLYDGHRQPRLPAELGFYDLRTPETRQAQADLAAEHGIHGFCYYYYWFNGRRILDRPLAEMLASGQPDFPFLICWANENWTRRWDGLGQDVLLEQRYSPDSHRRFISDVIPILGDPRYVRYQGKPVLLVYRIRDIPDVRSATEMWRAECRAAGLGEIHLAAVRFWDVIDVTGYGFDAAVDFPPHHVAVKNVAHSLPGLVEDFSGLAYDYEHLVRENLRTMGHGYASPAHRGVMLAWDNTPRRGSAAHFAHGATPELYGQWLRGVLEQESAHNRSDESLIFINAWNEWAEGANLEPDSHFGRRWLDVTMRSLRDQSGGAPSPTQPGSTAG